MGGGAGTGHCLDSFFPRFGAVTPERGHSSPGLRTKEVIRLIGNECFGTSGALHNNLKSTDMNTNDKKDKSRNPDPITGAPGSHPVGTGLGAVAGGAAAGAATGTVAGPVGTVIGAAVGAVVGGLAGKGIAEKIDPTREDAYWRENHASQPYGKNRAYDDYDQAYRVGYVGYSESGSAGKTFEEQEAELRRRYESSQPKLTWNEARPASYAAWKRIDESHRSAPPGESRRPL